ncbi:MAG: hypothetical protein K2G94_01670 [Muribaculaceae bacterium]|nr:hypothetical protein [Muribaculaceae bacterium]MDE6461780.1 hypothetical protein [Muribaculaceae bacterium]
MKGKKIYQQPETVVTRVELESPICSGSTEIEATSPGATTTSQKINDSFSSDNSFGDGTGWDNVTIGN